MSDYFFIFINLLSTINRTYYFIHIKYMLNCSLYDNRIMSHSVLNKLAISASSCYTLCINTVKVRPCTNILKYRKRKHLNKAKNNSIANADYVHVVSLTIE